MKRSLHSRLIQGPLLGALVFAMSPATATPAEPPPMPDAPSEYFAIQGGPAQVVMVPVGEGDRTGAHLRVNMHQGILKSAKYHGACGAVMLHGPAAERMPAFAPTPTAPGIPSQSVCGEASCGCPTAALNVVHVTQPPIQLVSVDADMVGRFVPVLPGGDTPLPVADAAEPGCFGWLELVVDTTGLKVGAQLLATIETYLPGAILTGPPTSSEVVTAALISQ